MISIEGVKGILQKTSPFLIGILLFLLVNSPARPDDFGAIWGLCQDSSETPLPQVQIAVTNIRQQHQISLRTDEFGEYCIAGLAAGLYSLRFEKEGFSPITLDNIPLDPSQTLYLAVTLSIPPSAETAPRLISLDYSNNLHQTILNESQIHDNPSAHNVWSLIENQDLSATTNRIDIGGLWGNQPALFGSRGSSSWTQNIYLLNGFDVTDPYWTGLPLFYPDFFSLQYTQLINAGHPPFALSPGGYFNLMTREESPVLTGSIGTFYIQKSFQSSNITPILEREGIFESHGFDYFADGNIRLSGPVVPGKLFFFASGSAFSVGRDLAECDTLDKSTAVSGLFSLRWLWPNSYLRLLWTGQMIYDPAYGAGRDIPYSSTNKKRALYNILQLVWNSRIANRHVLHAGVSVNLGDQHSDFQEDNFPVHTEEIFTGIPAGIAPYAADDRRRTLSILFRGESLLPGIAGALHKLQYGFQLKYSDAKSYLDVQEDFHLHTFNGDPLEVVFFNTPVEHREAAYHLNFYVQESMIFSHFFSFYFGAHVAMSKGWIPRIENNSINWINLSPRLGLVFPLSQAKTSALKFSAARYYHTLPLHYLSYGNPDALGGDIFVWEDDSQDNIFQLEETGILLRKEGPFYAQIAPELKRPFTDELSLAYVYTFSSNWTLTVAGFVRRTKNLVETTNIGVPFSSYETVKVEDIGDDRIPDTPDDLTFTVYNQSPDTLGQDFFLLTNADAEDRESRYYGLDLTLVKRYGERFTFFLSLTAVQAKGTANPGNSEWENDDGVVGILYDNPNSLINTEGRLRFDRGYTGRLGLSYLAPLGIRIGMIIKYYDGQPFARKIIVTGMNQGPFYIQAHPRGKARYEYNRTIDIRIEKIINLGETRFRITLDGFNITNRSLATEENEWTGPEFPLRFATEVQSPRVFRIGMSYEF